MNFVNRILSNGVLIQSLILFMILGNVYLQFMLHSEINSLDTHGPTMVGDSFRIYYTSLLISALTFGAMLLFGCTLIALVLMIVLAVFSIPMIFAYGAGSFFSDGEMYALIALLVLNIPMVWGCYIKAYS